jgi:hypothetical protein
VGHGIREVSMYVVIKQNAHEWDSVEEVFGPFDRHADG